MVRAFSENLRWRVIYLQNSGLSSTEISRSLCVGHTFVKKVIRIYRQTTGVKYPENARGRPRIITAQNNLLIRRLVDQYPEIHLDELQNWIEHVTGEQYSISTLCRFIRNAGLTLKRNHVIARQRNEILRAQYRRFISSFNKDQFLFIDESAKDERSLQRKYGYSLQGCRLARKGNFTRGKRYSVLAAMSTTGIKTAHSINGAYDRSQFEFVYSTFVLPYIGSVAQHEPCSVVVLDNCAIHFSDEVYQMTRDKDAIIVFLPPYSPDLNPIETCFGTAKMWMKSHMDICDRYPKRCFEIALQEITQSKCNRIISSCGYA